MTVAEDGSSVKRGPWVRQIAASEDPSAFDYHPPRFRRRLGDSARTGRSATWSINMTDDDSYYT